MKEKNIILYADDDLDDILLVKEAFDQHINDIELVTVNDGKEALTFLLNLPENKQLPCLIVLDVNMPKMDGKEVLIKLRSLNRFKHIPAILFTTSSQLKDKEFASLYNAGFLTKPLSYNQMDNIASELINHCSDDIKKMLK